ncbi:MAG: hypothetical protein J7621_27205, partial [Niastella sp.]|nr:hypothetical protein [Niastella sp.]
LKQFIPELEKIIRKNSKRMRSIYQELSQIYNDPDREQTNKLIYSYIHMFVNRLFNSYHPDTENRLYFFLNKLYLSRQARAKIATI